MPTVTVLISNMGDTVVGWLKAGTLWVGEHTILPDKERRREQSEKRDMEKDKQEKSQGDDKRTRGLGRDVERLGEAVEHAEEEQGREGSLAARIAKEISGVAKDIGRKPPKKYSWHEWTRMLDLMGKKGSGVQGDSASSNCSTRSSHSSGVDWTWLGDDGPLLSRETETEWVLEKLCTRLEEVLEEELRDARRAAKGASKEAT